MALETGTYISSLVATNPTTGDPKSQGDDHLRLIKSTILASFPAITGAVTATHAELNILDGVTSTAAELNILDGVTSTAAEINVLDGITATTAELNGESRTYSGTHDFTPATINVSTLANTTNTTEAASTAFVQSVSMQTITWPAQAGNTGKYVKTDGTSATWEHAIDHQFNFHNNII